MKEIKAIIEAYDSIDWDNTKAALATVVRVEGSSYRRTGARMLVLDNGVWVGGISGGCLEGDALKRAKLAIYKSEPSLVTYDTTTDDENQIGVGLGCNGIIDVLFCPLDNENKSNPVEILKGCIQNKRETNIIITITGLNGTFENLKIGKAIIFDLSNSLKDFGENTPAISEIIEIQINKGHSSPKQLILDKNHSINFFIEILPPEIHLILFGHQYDVFPLARLIKEMGWKLTIIANPLKLNRLILKLADEIFSIEQFDMLIIDDFTATILMSHDYKTDKSNFTKLINSPSKYIGMLGPKVRSEKIISEYLAENNIILEKDLNRIFAPIGLDIGAISPEEIALSLIAEVRSVFSNRTGQSLRNRTEPIHERI